MSKAQLIHCEKCGATWADDGFTGSCPMCRITYLENVIESQQESNESLVKLIEEQNDE